MINDTYIPKGKNIKTTHGCICKSEYKSESGNKIKDSCSLDDATIPWCLVEGKCGQRVSNGKLKGKWWDKCTASSGVPEEFIYGKNYFWRNMKGIIIFNIIFVITIPLLLYRQGFHELLEVYMPNFDLLATAVSFGGGPGDTRIFQELYNPASSNLMGQTSTLLINYMSLLGLTYLVARRVNLTKSLAKGWGIGFVMLLLTYLVPNEIIESAQHKSANYFFSLKPGQNKPMFDYFSVVAVGLGIAGMFILAEKTILENHKTLIDPFIKKLLQVENFFKK